MLLRGLAWRTSWLSRTYPKRAQNPWLGLRLGKVLSYSLFRNKAFNILCDLLNTVLKVKNRMVIGYTFATS